MLQSAQYDGDTMSKEKEQLAELVNSIIQISQELSKINETVKSDAIAYHIMRLDEKIMEASEILTEPEPTINMLMFIGPGHTCQVLNDFPWWDLIFRSCF